MDNLSSIFPHQGCHFQKDLESKEERKRGRTRKEGKKRGMREKRKEIRKKGGGGGGWEERMKEIRVKEEKEGKIRGVRGV